MMVTAITNGVTTIPTFLARGFDTAVAYVFSAQAVYSQQEEAKEKGSYRKFKLQPQFGRLNLCVFPF